MPHHQEILNLQERCTRLEETCYFQESTINALHEALAQQQRQMDALEKTLADAAEKLRRLHALLDASGGEATPPPHSDPGLY